MTEKHILQRIADLSTFERPFSIYYESDYYYICIGDLKYITTHFTNESLFNALIYLTAQVGLKEKWWG